MVTFLSPSRPCWDPVNQKKNSQVSWVKFQYLLFCPIRLLLFDLFQRDENGYNLANMIKTIIFKTLIISAHLLDSCQFFLFLFISEWRWNFSNNSVKRGGSLLYDFWWTQTPVLTPSTGCLGCRPQMTLWTKLPILFSSALSQELGGAVKSSETIPS